MITALYYVSCISVVLAVVLAVARGLPLLHLLALPDVESELIRHVACLALIILGTVGVGVYQGFAGHTVIAAAWVGGVALFWWWVGWHLWERR